MHIQVTVGNILTNVTANYVSVIVQSSHFLSVIVLSCNVLSCSAISVVRHSFHFVIECFYCNVL